MPYTLTLPYPPGQISDGYHTFDELYEHRCLLLFALMKSHPDISWISNRHEDGSCLDGWSIIGMQLPTGDITYHIPDRFWSLANKTGAKFLCNAPPWDGHTSADVAARLTDWLKLELK